MGGGSVGGGDQVDAVVGAAGVMDLTVVEVATLVEGLAVKVVDGGAVVVGGAAVVLLGRVTYAKGVGVGGSETPS